MNLKVDGEDVRRVHGVRGALKDQSQLDQPEEGQDVSQNIHAEMLQLVDPEDQVVRVHIWADNVESIVQNTIEHLQPMQCMMHGHRQRKHGLGKRESMQSAPEVSSRSCKRPTIEPERSRCRTRSSWPRSRAWRRPWSGSPR